MFLSVSDCCVSRKRQRLRQHNNQPNKSVKKQSKFQKLVNQLSKKGVKEPKALAAWIGRRKYGKERFQQMSQEGRK